jgi:hypothetical protein
VVLALAVLVSGTLVPAAAGAAAGSSGSPVAGSADRASDSRQLAALHQVRGEPELDLAAPNNRIGPSERTRLTVLVSNAGELDRTGPAPLMDRVTAARNVKLTVLEGEIEAPIEVKSGTVLLSALPNGRQANASFALETGDDLQPGTYRIPIRVEYEHTSSVIYRTDPTTGTASIVDTSDDWTDDRHYIKLVVDESPRFEVVAEQSRNLYAGDTGQLNVTIRNVGSATASDATLRLQSRSPVVFFGSQTRPQRNTSLFLSELAPGETHTTSVDVGATGEATRGSYPVGARVVYRNENEVRGASNPMQLGVTVRPERQFALQNLTAHRLRVGEDDAVVTGRIVNRGPAPARNAVVTLATGSAGPSAGTSASAAAGAVPAATAAGPVTVVAPESSVGTLAPGESRRVRFRVSVSGDADPGSQMFVARVEYENAAGDVRRSTSPLRQSLRVHPEQDTITVRDVNSTVTAGGSGLVRVTIENTGSRPISEANAKLFVNDPLSSSDNEAFLGRLEAGETRTVVFKLSASSQAVAKEYAGSIEVRYEDADGDTELTDGLQVGLPVRGDDGGVPIPFVTAGVGVLGLSGLVFVYQRRRIGHR